VTLPIGIIKRKELILGSSCHFLRISMGNRKERDIFFSVSERMKKPSPRPGGAHADLSKSSFPQGKEGRTGNPSPGKALVDFLSPRFDSGVSLTKKNFLSDFLLRRRSWKLWERADEAEDPAENEFTITPSIRRVVPPPIFCRKTQNTRICKCDTETSIDKVRHGALERISSLRAPLLPIPSP